MTVLMQVLTLFVLMLCGLTAAKTRMLDDRGFGAINAFVLNFALSGLILSTMQQDMDPALLGELAWMFVLSCACMALGGFVACRVFVREPEERRAVLVNLCTLSNCAYMGYPIITAALGAEALLYAVLYSAAFNLLTWTLCAYFFGGCRAVQPRYLFRNPSLIAVLFGFVLLITGWRLPTFLNDALSALGATTTPLAMFVIGARLTTLRPAHLRDTRLLLACLLRLVILPLPVLLLKLTPLSSTLVQVLYLCVAMPSAALTAMQAEQYHCDRDLASRGVALSTALSLVTIPLMLTLL